MKCIKRLVSKRKKKSILSFRLLKKPSRLVSWHAPIDNIVKLNVDGSSLDNPGGSGFCGLIRNDKGEWLIGFSGFCGITTNLNAELMAIDHGLSLAWSYGYRDVVCESDSKSALDLILGGVFHTHPYAAVIAHIRSFMSYAWNLSFGHTLREGNASAD